LVPRRVCRGPLTVPMKGARASPFVCGCRRAVTQSDLPFSRTEYFQHDAGGSAPRRGAEERSLRRARPTRRRQSHAPSSPHSSPRGQTFQPCSRAANQAAKDKSASCPIAPMVRSEPLNDSLGQIQPWCSIGGDSSLPFLASVPVGCRLRKEWADAVRKKIDQAWVRCRVSCPPWQSTYKGRSTPPRCVASARRSGCGMYRELL
jgi:hypothetical protein